MGTEYSFGLGIGYELSVQAVMEKYGSQFPEESHMEDRFDPKTGEKLDSVTVVDRYEGRYLVIDGKEVNPEEDPIFMTELLEAEWDLGVELVRQGPDGGREEAMLLISTKKSLRVPDVSTFCLSMNHVEADGGFEIQALAKTLPKLKRVGAKLKKLGFKVGEPMVRIIGSWG